LGRWSSNWAHEGVDDGKQIIILEGRNSISQTIIEIQLKKGIKLSEKIKPNHKIMMKIQSGKRLKIKYDIDINKKMIYIRRTV
jgi:hypothetical protein